MHEQLYQDNRGLLWYWANRYARMCGGCGIVDAEDLAQAGFFGLVDAQRTYKADCGAWSSWASFYIRRSMRDALGMRGKRRLQAVSLDMPVDDEDSDRLGDLIADESLPDPDAEILHNELTEAVRTAVNALKNEQARQAIQMVYFDGKTAAEAAAVLNVKPEKVSRLLNKGKDALSKDMRLRRAVPELDEMTLFHARKGLDAFRRDWTSVVEAAVLWREAQRERIGG